MLLSNNDVEDKENNQNQGPMTFEEFNQKYKNKRISNLWREAVDIFKARKVNDLDLDSISANKQRPKTPIKEDFEKVEDYYKVNNVKTVEDSLRYIDMNT